MPQDGTPLAATHGAANPGPATTSSHPAYLATSGDLASARSLKDFKEVFARLHPPEPHEPLLRYHQRVVDAYVADGHPLTAEDEALTSSLHDLARKIREAIDHYLLWLEKFKTEDCTVDQSHRLGLKLRRR
ncbi:hypothetical protein AURDEDRAFT_172352 [Auricularia subglabra TFB-10046 SS5]|nr:hypothetical protein AURDEDRAFT_172352 [Auricularia subglabra TFB-10046 SS5]